MPKIRAIHPSFWNDTTLAECSTSARLFYIGLWNFADDAGVFEFHHKLLKSQVFPFDEIDVKPLLDELLTHNRISCFEHSGRDYGLIVNFAKYQKPDSRYLRYLIPDFENVKIASHIVNPTSTLGEPHTDSDSDSDGVIDKASEKNEKLRRPIAEIESSFYDVAVEQGWCDRPYIDKTLPQAAALTKEHRTEYERKIRVAFNSWHSTGEQTKKLAKKMFHEIAGHINDFGDMQRMHNTLSNTSPNSQ